MVRSSDPTVVDLFSGAGLFSWAFVREGFRLTQAIDADRFAAETHAINLGAEHVVHADVAEVRPTGRCDVLVAGPPCQGFSTLGAMREDDPRNGLSMHVVRFARVLRPSLIVIENVAAFLRSPAWSRLARALIRLGYEVDTHVLNALDFGAAQVRVRSFTIASRVGLPNAPRPRGTAATVREAFDGLAKRPDGSNHHYAPTPSALALARMKVIPPGGDKRDVLARAPHLAPPSWRRPRAEITDVWGRMRWEAPSNTLRTALQNPSKGRYIHPSQHRVISLREAARLQTIPDEWTFSGPPYPVARQIGNSVPPVLGRAIARAVRRALG